MGARPLFLCLLTAASSLIACSCSVQRAPTTASVLPATANPSDTPETVPDEPADSPSAKDFETAIASAARTDPNSPAVLNAKLDYAEFLLDGTPDTCLKRLEQAQEQLGSVDANPKSRVMFPDGWATVADLEFRLHLARSSCVKESERKDELRVAVAEGRRAVEFYRNAFDYHSMVIMQFDVSTTLHQLGDSAAALQALQTTLDMDKEYAFKDDAAENYKLLLTWQGEPAGSARVAELIKDFPKRQAVMTFGWHTGNARTLFENHRVCLVDGQVTTGSRAGATFDRHIRADEDGSWNVSYSHRLDEYEPGVWPTMERNQTPLVVFPPVILPAVGFKVSGTGEFDGVTDATTFAAQLATKAQGLIRAAAPSGPRARNLLDSAVETAEGDLAPGMLEAAAAENYQIETAMWIGATLEQGVWYEIDAPLPIPGMPRVVIQNKVQFAFTRLLPCTAGAADPTCVEIVLHATPDKEALNRVIGDLTLPPPHNQFDHYTASTQARIVTDPATLLPYAREERIYWYASIDGGNSAILQSEHVLSTTKYGAP
jgi:hypothetical protein